MCYVILYDIHFRPKAPSGWGASQWQASWPVASSLTIAEAKTVGSGCGTLVRVAKPCAHSIHICAGASAPPRRSPGAQPFKAS